jgi:hypothetical protein
MPARSNINTAADGADAATGDPAGATATVAPSPSWAELLANVRCRRSHGEIRVAKLAINGISRLRDAESAHPDIVVPPAKPGGGRQPNSVADGYQAVTDALDARAPLSFSLSNLNPSRFPSASDGGTTATILTIGGYSIVTNNPDDKVIAATTNLVQGFLFSRESGQTWCREDSWADLDAVRPDLFDNFDPDRNMTGLVVATMLNLKSPPDTKSRLAVLRQFIDEHSAHFPDMSMGQFLSLVGTFQLATEAPEHSSVPSSFFNWTSPHPKRKGHGSSRDGDGDGAAKRRTLQAHGFQDVSDIDSGSEDERSVYDKAPSGGGDSIMNESSITSEYAAQAARDKMLAGSLPKIIQKSLGVSGCAAIATINRKTAFGSDVMNGGSILDPGSWTDPSTYLDFIRWLADPNAGGGDSSGLLASRHHSDQVATSMLKLGVTIGPNAITRLGAFILDLDSLSALLPNPDAARYGQSKPSPPVQHANSAAASSTFPDFGTSAIILNALTLIFAPTVGPNSADRMVTEVHDIIQELLIETWGDNGLDWRPAQDLLRFWAEDMLNHWIDQVSRAAQDHGADWAQKCKADASAISLRTRTRFEQIKIAALDERQMRKALRSVQSQSGGGSSKARAPPSTEPGSAAAHAAIARFLKLPAKDVQNKGAFNSARSAWMKANPALCLFKLAGGRGCTKEDCSRCALSM